MARYTQHSGRCRGFLTSSCLTKSTDGSVDDMPLNLGLMLKPSLLNNPRCLLYRGRVGLQLWEGCTCNAADVAYRTCLLARALGMLQHSHSTFITVGLLPVTLFFLYLDH